MGKKIVVNESLIISRIHLIRGQKVMTDEDLAEMYGVETKRLNEQVRRNLKRFPKDFMFQLTESEYKNLKSQIASSSWGGRRKRPYVFSEHGVLMLSSVLNSTTAIQVNIKIMRAYVQLRELLITHKDILFKLEQMEKQVTQNSKEIQIIFSALKLLQDPPQEPRKRIGYKKE